LKTTRISTCFGLCLLAVLACSFPVLAQSPQLEADISTYQQRLEQESAELRREQLEETTDQRLLRHLKSSGGVKYVQQETALTKEIEQEKRFEFECQNNINNLRGWIVYDQTMEQKAEMEAQYARHNAYEAEVDKEVAARNAYVPPPVNASGSPLWGMSSEQYQGYGYGGGGYGGHFHSSGGGVHWHSSGGHSGGGHSSGGGGHARGR
jgi:hypothetical protein